MHYRFPTKLKNKKSSLHPQEIRFGLLAKKEKEKFHYALCLSYQKEKKKEKEKKNIFYP